MNKSVKKVLMILMTILIIIIPFIKVNTENSWVYSINSGSWVKYRSQELFESYLIINSSVISHNDTLTYHTKATVSEINSSSNGNEPFGTPVGDINGSITESGPGISQTINNVNIGPFQGFFYPIWNLSKLNQTMVNLNNSVDSIFVDKNNASDLPSDVKMFLNPVFLLKVENLSAQEMYTFYGYSNDTIEIKPKWYTKITTRNVLILNFDFQLNISAFFNLTYDAIDWKITRVESQIEIKYAILIDSMTGLVLQMVQTGDIDYYESNSINQSPYFGLPYNLSYSFNKSRIILNSNIINFGINIWIWIIIGVIISGILFVIFYVKLTSPKKSRKDEKLIGNILEK